MAITLKQALEILHSGNWCSIRFLTANIAKGTGGKVIELAKCRIARNRELNKQHTAPEEKNKAITSEPKKDKDPNHNLHFTRNVELQNKSIMKVHPILITHINNSAVL